MTKDDIKQIAKEECGIPLGAWAASPVLFTEAMIKKVVDRAVALAMESARRQGQAAGSEAELQEARDQEREACLQILRNNWFKSQADAEAAIAARGSEGVAL